MRNLFEPDYGVRHDWIPAEQPPQPRQWTAKELTELAKRIAAGGNLSLAAFIRPDFRKYRDEAIVPCNSEARAMLEGIDPR